MQQFVLEEHFDILCSGDEIELEELMELAENGALWYIRQNGKVRPYPLNQRSVMLKILNSGQCSGETL